jgi:hypothetical protein
MEMKESRRAPSLFTLSGREGVLLPLPPPHPAALLRFFKRRSAAFPPLLGYYLSIPFHARHWLWIQLGLKAAVGQTITRTTDEANLFIQRWYMHNYV